MSQTIPSDKIHDTTDAWDPSGVLGNTEEFTAVAPDVSAVVDASLGLQPISIRLQKDLLESLKQLAKLHGIGYQPLVRQVLTRFVDCEMKRLLNEKVAQEFEAIKDETTSLKAPYAKAA
jgi:hypothetical protein